MPKDDFNRMRERGCEFHVDGDEAFGISRAEVIQRTGGQDNLHRRTHRHRLVWYLAGLLVVSGIGWAVSSIGTTKVLDSKTVCVRPDSGVNTLATFSDLVGRPVNCVILFNDANPGWAQWVNPWFTHISARQNDWSAWLRAKPATRRVVVTQEMVPNNVPSNWRELGATGAYDRYARQLGVNLVADGMSDAVIRLGHEMNGDWYHDSLGNDPAQFRDWRDYWRRIVKIMRAVPGNHFLFDWCVNAGYRNIPLNEYYPGNQFVDIIGIDAYDSGMPGNPRNEQSRWISLDREHMGVMQIVDFARKNGKPLSFPEWGLVSPSRGGLGDDPTYVRGIATTVVTNNVAYEAYYDRETNGTMRLGSARRSLNVWKDYFGSERSAAGHSW